MNNIIDKAEYTCSGCGACHAVCPVKAIKLKKDDYGFFVADVDENTCISCGLCKTVCTRYDQSLNGISLLNSSLYALRSSDQSTVKNCSSGGIASELAEYAISKGYKVTAVYYDLENNIACHKTVSTANEIKEFAGSKYLQSNSQILREAVKEKGFIFGTPCQIAGLHKVLSEQGKRNDFILIEIFCHGVPSYKLWDEELKLISKKLGSNQFDNLQFRYKKYDWHMYCIKAEKNGKIYYGEREKDPFWQVYFEDMLLSDACYNCRFRKENSYADIRLGDYWGNKYSNDSQGVSAVFCMTENGRGIIDDLIHNGKVIELEKTSNEEMMQYQNMKGYRHGELHKEVLERLKNSDDINKVIEYYHSRLPVKRKIKRTLLRLSGIIPGNLRYRMKKALRF
ncbi:MAG: Coenzyme F420 hydrogenase/dehydrogenase, beta subunit C-terminal domain [Erysipelotrichaceae bacterium]|nr:Coenzyme F420 hydrogenase/dehydrogenase, beta subunit C-terminal domain [Erysipelotrichaceae bacterium]